MTISPFVDRSEHKMKLFFQVRIVVAVVISVFLVSGNGKADLYW